VPLGDIPRRNARRFPERAGLVCGDTRLTWAQVNRRVNGLANGLAGRGIGRGDRVAILARNDRRFLELYWALAKLGAIAVPLNYRLTDAEMRGLVEHAGVRLLVAGPGYEDAIAGLDRLQFPDLDALIVGGSAAEPGVPVGADDPAAIMYTSGTTGLPKGAVVTHGNLENNALIQAIADKADPADVNLTATPLYHMGALFMATTYTALGCTNVVLEAFDPPALLAAAERERVTTCLLVPTMLNMVLEHPTLADHDLSALRLIFYGGSPMPTTVLRRAIDALKCDFTQGYGLTETIEATFLVAADHRLDGDPDRERRLASAGREAVNAEVRIVADDGEELPTGEVGEIVIRSPSCIHEYWRAPEETARAVRDGWWHTGDLGYRDDGGYLFVVDRKKDLIITGGENVYPTDVEEVLYAHPGVLEAAVIGLPDAKWGEAVTAIVARRDEALAEDDLLGWCRERLGGHKRPRAVRFVDALPRNPSGKVLKRELRTRFAPEEARA
jgi:acyl-CoA synthetase (AMP-forming)/AMP-acid ligase II